MVTPFHTLKAARFLQLLHLRTRYPVWSLLLTIHQRKRLALLSQALQRNKIPTRKFEAMKGIISQGDITDALGRARGDIPPWLVLYLIAYKVRSPLQAAHSMLDLAHSNLSSSHFPTELDPGLVILTMLSLSRFGLVPQMHPLISRFLALPELVPSYPDPSSRNPALPAAYFNILLLAMTSTPKYVHSTDLANGLLSLLKSMHARRVNLWADTRTELLQDRYLLIELTKYLRSKSQPTRSQLERDLTLFGPLDNPSNFSEVVSRELALTDPAVNVPSAFEFLRAMVPPGHLKPASVDMKDSEGQPDSLEVQQATQTMHTRILKKDLKPTLGILTNPHEPVIGDVPSSSPPLTPQIKMSWDQAFTVAARDTRTISADMLVFFFERAFGVFSDESRVIDVPTSAEFRSDKDYVILTLPPPPRPSISHFTTLLNGLLARHVSIRQTSLNPDRNTNAHHRNAHIPELALKYWHVLRASGLMLDPRAVGIGARVLIMQDHPTSLTLDRRQKPNGTDTQEVENDPRGSKGWGVCAAWDLLESFCSPQSESIHTLCPLPLSTISLNDIFVSLNRIGRPDVVMRMWDGWVRPFHYFYNNDARRGYPRTQGLHTVAKSPPDSRSLCILIQSVRTATRLDGSLLGTWRQWRELHRLRSMRPAEVKQKLKKRTREDFVRDVESVLWNIVEEQSTERRRNKQSITWERAGRRGYVDGTLWNGELPIDEMRRIMRGIVWEAGALRAQAYQSANEEELSEEDNSSNWMRALDTNPPARPMKELMHPDRWRILPPLPTLAALKDFFTFKNWLGKSRESEVPRPSSTTPSSKTRSSQLASPRPFAPSTSRLTFPKVTLTPEVFHEYILLLGTATSSSPFVHSVHDVSTPFTDSSVPETRSNTSPAEISPIGLAPTSHPYHPEIPIVLGWMRHLGVKPKTYTLAASLVFWGEVTVPTETLDAALSASFNDIQDGDREYEKLVRWIADWVNELKENEDADVRMPTPRDLGKWRTITRKIRENRRSDWLEDLTTEGVREDDDVGEGKSIEK
ncbi:hypothetical protein K435DRAFT_278820 [Dendrothele bispora CBS 962.96]|uniref:Uncharacterized protein n=1 Tax=Dendrothele bispora (strain CBS 962.96) TaxID=1314807 RepID=A0A4S8ML05_DENBC|nr:hypothetical protein K435DRAFT_278820 [Dendrothele bispora CBS 962.96]